MAATSLHRTGRLFLLATLFVTTMAAADGPVVVRTLRELREAVRSQQRALCNVQIEAVVCAVDHPRGLVALQDDTGAEVLSLKLDGEPYQPGDRLRLTSAHCALIRRKWDVALTTPPVVDNGGVHSAQETSGNIQLATGRHPIGLFYFNVKNPALLEVRYAGPGVVPQPIPASVLFPEADSADPAQRGLRFLCYDDMPATLDRARHQTPIHSGIATHFDISVRRPEENVAMEFCGFIEITRPGEYEFTVRSDDAGELYIGELRPEIIKLGRQHPPAAPQLPNAMLAAPLEQGQWRTLEGVVTFAGWERNGLEIVLKEDNRTTRLWLASDEGVPFSLLPEARLRATGVHCRTMGLDGDRQTGLLAVVGAGNVQLLEVAPEQWRKNPHIAISNVPALAKMPGTIVHLRGTADAFRPDGAFRLQDGTASITVQTPTSGGLTNGSAVEVLGVVTFPPSGPSIGPAFCRPLASLPAAPATFTTAAQVQQLSARDAARQHAVTVRGVITCLVEWGGAVVQDATRGVFFSVPTSYRDGLEPGDFAEISGVTDVGDFAPVITAQSVRVLGRAQMPEPVRPNWNQLMSGSLDSQYAEVRGIVTEADGNRITLLTESGKIKVVLHNTGEAALKRLLNTLVRIRGGLFAQWDAQTRQVRVGEIKFWNPKIEIDQLPMAEPFSAPVKTISDLLLFDLNASGFQRVKVSGQIVHVRGDELFLMQDGMGLRFRLTEKTSLKAGDLVDVVGIPELSEPSPRLHEAVVRKTGEAQLPPAQPWPDEENAGAKLDATRVQTVAKLIGIHRTGAEWVMEVQTGLRAYRALVSTPDNLAETLPLGSRLELSGVYAMQGGGKNDELSAFELLLNSATDIRLIERPPWWTLRRLLYIVATLIAVLTVAAIWINQLQRQVAHRTRLLEREHARREHAERERALELERSRIARDLHDDLGSSLTEIRVMASTGLRTKEADGKSPLLFNAITEKARSLIAALDVIVWAVDPEANSLQSLADYLSGYADEYLAHSNITCRFKIPASLPSVTLDGRIRHDLFLAVKETLHNVVRHSQATEVEFQLSVGEGAIEISISDNGAGFKVEAMKDGHGLKNISGRLNKIGGSCKMESLAGVGTKVSISLPLPATKEGESVPPPG